MTQQVKVGQVWREVDPRHDRKVVIVEIDEQAGKALLLNLNASPGVKPTRASLKRFHGRRGGYALVSESA